MSRILEPGQIESAVPEAPFLRLPQRRAFEERAARFETLAAGHPLGDYLAFLGRLSRAQQLAVEVFPGVTLPDEAQSRLCREHGMPPLGTHSLRRSAAWREALGRILDGLDTSALPAQTQAAIERLRGSGAEALEAQAESLLSGDYGAADLAAAPFVAAALQVYWVRMASGLRTKDVGRPGATNLCPVCGSPPVASSVRIGGAEAGLRYLCCSLCGSEWNLVRGQCAQCNTAKGLAYYGIEGDSGAVKAETCDGCGSYLKISYMAKDPNVDPIADDVATLALDFLMAEKGKGRSGPNLFLLQTDE